MPLEGVIVAAKIFEDLEKAAKGSLDAKGGAEPSSPTTKDVTLDKKIDSLLNKSGGGPRSSLKLDPTAIQRSTLRPTPAFHRPTNIKRLSKSEKKVSIEEEIIKNIDDQSELRPLNNELEEDPNRRRSISSEGAESEENR
jgi:hypothetical protein